MHEDHTLGAQDDEVILFDNKTPSAAYQSMNQQQTVS